MTWIVPVCTGSSQTSCFDRRPRPLLRSRMRNILSARLALRSARSPRSSLGEDGRTPAARAQGSGRFLPAGLAPLAQAADAFSAARLLFVSLIGVSSARAQVSPDEREILDALDPTAVVSLTRRLSEEVGVGPSGAGYGSAIAGSPAEKALADFLEKQMRARGFDVARERFPVRSYDYGEVNRGGSVGPDDVSAVQRLEAQARGHLEEALLLIAGKLREAPANLE